MTIKAALYNIPNITKIFLDPCNFVYIFYTCGNLASVNFPDTSATGCSLNIVFFLKMF